MTTADQSTPPANDEIADAAELARVNNELRAAIRELEDHEQDRLRFVDNASHELRTPLAAMSYTIGNLLQNIAGPVPNRVREYLEMLRDECQRMVGTVTRILDLNRIDAATVELHRMKIPLYRFVRTTVDSVAASARDKSQDLVLLPSETTTGFVSVDPLRFGNVLSSILVNAIQFTPDDGHIDVGLEWIRESTWMELTVTDDGPGIAPEDLPHVTERYYRVGEFVKGSGLGLAFAQEMIALHGGELEIVSPVPDRPDGTRVVIRVPRADPLRVMAIDDSATILMLIERQLVHSGYSVETCSTAEAALEALQGQPPEMIVVDSIMPGMHGTEFVSRIKAMRELRAIPILMLTGAELDRDTRLVLESFAVPVLAKPWTADELLIALEDAIYGKRYLQG